ncbi:MAG: ABC transporter permease [Gaiellales bacterium]
MREQAAAPIGLPAAQAQGELEELVGEARAQWQLILGRFLHHRLAMASLLVLVVLFGMAFFGQSIAPYRYDHLDPTALSEPPSLKHYFGTDSIGHDTFAQVLRGARRSIIVALLVSLLSTAIGTTIGALAGYFRGWLDAALMRLTDLFLTIPALALLLVVAAKFRGQNGNWIAIALLIAAFFWMGLARVVRGVFLSLREREFVEAARAAGASDARIIVRHLVPNSLGPIIVGATLVVAQGILTEAALSFLGFGIAPPDTSLGRLVAEGVTAAQTRPWLFYMPGLFLMMIALAVNFIGDGLRDAFDPKQTRVRA